MAGYLMSKYAVFPGILLLLVCVWCPSGDILGETVVELQKGWLTLGDTLPMVGSFVQPRICPVDTSYVAYEIRDDSTSRLYIYYVGTEKTRLILPQIPIDSADFTPEGNIACGNLAWCPVSFGGHIWTAFLADIDGTAGVYLHDLTSAMSYRVWDETDSPDDTAAAAWGVPRWSPDGMCLAFTAVKGTDADILIVCNMAQSLGHPADGAGEWNVYPLIDGSGNQFDPVWCPVDGSGILAYTEQETDTGRLRILLFDIYKNRSFGLTSVDSLKDYFGPSWSAGGRRIAYYRHDDLYEFWDNDTDHSEINVELQFAGITRLGDSLAISPQMPADASLEGTIKATPNSTMFSGPSWLPGGRHILVPARDDAQRVRLRVISIPGLAEADSRIDFALRGFGGGIFSYPRDVDIQSRNIAFVFGRSPRSQVVIGKLVPNLVFVSAVERLETDYERRIWWDSYVSQRHRHTGLFYKLWDFLWSPIAGPDIGINKRIVPIASGIVALAVVLSGDGAEDARPVPPRDWTPPEFPKACTFGPGLQVEFGL